MKRYGEKATREALAAGATIRYNDHFTLEAGYRVMIDGEPAGYIVFDLFCKLLQDGTIEKTGSGYAYQEYSDRQAMADQSARVEAATREALERAGMMAQEEPAPAAAEIDKSTYSPAGYIGKYDLFRKLEDGRGKWIAEDTETGEVFPITYDQARGFEPIRPDGVQRLSCELGRLLLPRR